MADQETRPSENEESSQQEVEEGAPSWTVTFGDMMSLLLTFFILLFSMSELKMDKFLLASQSLREAMGGTAPEVIDDPMGLMPDPVDPDLNMQAPGKTEGASENEGIDVSLLETFTQNYLELIRSKLQDFVEEAGLEETVNVDREEDGVHLRMEAVSLFGSGEARFAGEGRDLLRALSEITLELNVGIVVGGHADNLPINSPVFASNWELSAARAAGVARFLVEDGLPPTMIRVESYGEHKPVADNDTPEGRAKNRRVEIFFSRDDVMAAAISWTNGES